MTAGADNSTSSAISAILLRPSFCRIERIFKSIGSIELIKLGIMVFLIKYLMSVLVCKVKRKFRMAIDFFSIGKSKYRSARAAVTRLLLNELQSSAHRDAPRIWKIVAT